MAGVLDGVNQRTQLVGQNRLELLLFRLGKNSQRFGINVFKVQEVIQCPRLNTIPHAHPSVCGVATIRGRTFSIIDLSAAIGGTPVADINNSFVIVTEFNRSIQGFLVNGVDHIVNMNWEDILPPPKGTGPDSYMTAVTRINDELIEIIDVEQVLASVVPSSTQVSEDIANADTQLNHRILVADDSSVARNQIKRTMEQLGIECILVNDGREALDQLTQWADDGTDINTHIDMVISDIEMPEMDGYTLTTEIRKDDRLKGLYVMLHSSLSGVFNDAMVKKVGANEFIAKFSADELAQKIIQRLQERSGDQAASA